MQQFDLKTLLEKIRKEKPLVHNITNYVVMNFTANTLLAMGASPVMAHAPEEVEEMAGLAKSLVINIGTLSSPWIDSMVLAGLKANSLGVPVIFDPVGSGATSLRTRTSRMMVDSMKISVVRAMHPRSCHSLPKARSPRGLIPRTPLRMQRRLQGKSPDRSTQSWLLPVQSI